MTLNANQVSSLSNLLAKYDLFHVDVIGTDSLDRRVVEFKLWSFDCADLLHVSIDENGSVHMLEMRL